MVSQIGERRVCTRLGMREDPVQRSDPFVDCGELVTGEVIHVELVYGLV